MLNRLRLCAALLSRLVPVVYHMTHQKILLHTSESVKDRPESETWFVAREVLTKAIQACLTSLHSYSRNAGCGEKVEKILETPKFLHSTWWSSFSPREQ